MKVDQARALRRKATPAERKLWAYLRNRQVLDLKFRRQEPIKDRIVDFYCAEAKLAIELDGSGHRRHSNQTDDLDKELELYEMGIRMLRFDNQYVLSNIDGVISEIIYAIAPEKSPYAISNVNACSRESRIRPHLSPLPEGEEAVNVRDLQVSWLGRVGFAKALDSQETIVSLKREDRSYPDQVLLLEHDPVYTIGRTPNQSSLRGATHLPYPLFPINRGGQATYHGPGQLMGYPILDLRRHGQDLHRYLRWLEALIIELLAGHEIEAARREGLTGVWVQDRQSGSDRKIASIGVGVRHWITMHGFALNVGGDLSPFDHIVPCGIAHVTITSMEKERGQPFSLIDVAADFEKLILRRIHYLRP